MAETDVSSKYSGLIAQARNAFRTDPHYATVMAEQAYLIKARRETTEDEDASVAR